MSQTPLGKIYGIVAAAGGALMPAALSALKGANGANAILSDGGAQSARLNITAAAVVKTGKGRVGKLIIVAPGSTSGAWTINDNTALGGSNTAANTVFTMAFGATPNVVGAVISLDVPVANGIVVSAVPGSGSPVAVLTYD